MSSESFDAQGFWSQRHAVTDDLRAGGDKGLSVEENYEFYAIRVGKLLEIINRRHLGRRPLRILDAGCGNGLISSELQRCGHLVVGVDFSADAIEKARQTWPAVHFEISPLERIQLDGLFDVVFCVDVLFHIVDDEIWRSALGKLANHCASNGSLIITDTFTDDRFSMTDYIVHRAQQEYTDALAPYGFEPNGLFPYDYGSNPNAFAVFCRNGV